MELRLPELPRRPRGPELEALVEDFRTRAVEQGVIAPEEGA